jgi:hypothetical protein
MTLRGLFEFTLDAATAVPLDEVEPAAEIVKRFATGAMSLGSISTEAHATLAIAMNRIGGKSNTGEGGEDPMRYRAESRGHHDQGRRHRGRRDRARPDRGRHPADRPATRCARRSSRWPRAASASRAEYLAQRRPDPDQDGAGRQARRGRPAARPQGVASTSACCATRRRASGLISPPPHHDIYSIEDLAQLIHDLKNVNPRAGIVGQAGVRGGRRHGGRRRRQGARPITSSSPAMTAAPAPRRWSSIKHAGTPWELGLAETQQTLVLNRLRGRIAVQVDGQMKTGRDVVDRRAAGRRRVRLRHRAAGRRRAAS